MLAYGEPRGVASTYHDYRTLIFDTEVRKAGLFIEFVRGPYAILISANVIVGLVTWVLT